jgi:YD repeat-containing protein
MAKATGLSRMTISRICGTLFSWDAFPLPCARGKCPPAGAFTYDAENRQVTANINSSGSSYVYDGNGLRVQKTVPGLGTTDYVYDAWGNLVSEFYQSGTPPCVATCYVSFDHLGSTRLLTDSSGAVARRYDYLPFGGDLAGVNGRTTSLQYATDSTDVNPFSELGWILGVADGGND